MPDINIKIGRQPTETSIHALNKGIRRKISINKGDIIRTPALACNSHPEHLVRLSFSHKTVVYKKKM